MKFYTQCIAFLGLLLLGITATSCKDQKSYAELLNDERHAANAFLAYHRIVNEIPADTVFEVGQSAPYYRIDPDGNVYMQVLKASDRKADKPTKGQTIYFRYMRYNLFYWVSYGVLYNDGSDTYAGNEMDMSQAACYFNYNDYTLPSSSSWGYGIQMPLELLGINCEVNLLIKSQYGRTDEVSYVVPYLYHIRYYKSKI